MLLYYLVKRCTHFYEKHTKRIKNITRSQMIQHSLSNWSTVCTRQNLGRERSILQYVTSMLPSRLMFIKSVTLSVAASKWELSLASIRVKVNRLYCFHILLSQQMSDAIITSIVIQQDSAPAHLAFNTVHLLQCKTLNFPYPKLWPHNSPELVSADMRFRESQGSMSMSCKYQDWIN